MKSKIKLLAVASLTAVMATGCSGYRGASQAGTNPEVNSTDGTGGYSSSGQTTGGGFSQQRSRGVAVNDSCAICAASKAQNTYTYRPPVATKPAPRPATRPAPRPATKPVSKSRHSQQYYIDRWNRQQAALRNKPAPRPVQRQQPSTNYAGYGTTSQSNTTYYDYSSASRTNTQAPTPAAPTSNAASNKSIYTGSYQQNSYTPTTYAGGSAAKTSTTSSSSSSAGGGSTYVVKKGDTVFEIMRQTGVYWKDIISINNLQPPYSISPGQTIRLK